LVFALDDLRARRRGIPRAGQVIGEGTLPSRLLLLLTLQAAQQQVAAKWQHAEQPEEVTDETRQQQEQSAQRQQQAIEHFPLRQLTTCQALAGTPGRGQTGYPQQQDAQHGAEDNQTEGRQYANGTAHLNQQRQFQHRQQQQHEQRTSHRECSLVVCALHEGATGQYQASNRQPASRGTNNRRNTAGFRQGHFSGMLAHLTLT